MSAGNPFPSSTGLPREREPTRAERVRIWGRQVEGARALWRAEIERSKPFARSVSTLLLLQLVLALLVVPAVLSETVLASLVPTVLLVGAVLLAVGWSLRGNALLTRMATADIASKAARTVRASPIPSGAWLSGKVLVVAENQAVGAALLFPALAAGAGLTDRSLLDVALLVAVPLVGVPLPVAVAAIGLARSEEPVAARARGARRIFKAPGGQPGQQAAQAAGITFFMVVFGAMLVANLGGGGAGGSAFAWLAAVFPVVAAISAVAPVMSVTLAGDLVPAWVPSVLLYAAITPVAWSFARLRLQPGDSPTGIELRMTATLAWGVLGLALGLLLDAGRAVPSQGLLAALVIAPVLAGFVASTWAAAMSVGDVATPHVRGPRRLVALVRETAEVHGLLVAVVVAVALAWRLPADPLVALVGALVLLALPSCVLGAVLGRSGWRGAESRQFDERGPKGTGVAFLTVGWIFAALIALAVVAAIRSGEIAASDLPMGVTALCEVLAASNPLVFADHAVAAITGKLSGPLDLAGRALPLGAGIALQGGVALVAWWLDRWAARRWERWKRAEDEFLESVGGG